MCSRIFALAASAPFLMAASAHAQFVYGTWAWQISADEGQSWRGGMVDALPGQTLRVRALVGWDVVEGGPYAFGASQFDVAVAGPPGNADLVELSTAPGQGRISRGVSSNQTLVVARFGDTIKVDDSRDTAPPGWGNRGVYPGQFIEMYAGSNFTRDNPVSIFEFTLVLDATPGTRRVLDYFIAPPTGCFERSMRLYVTIDGTEQETLWNGCGRRQIVNIPLEVYVRCPSDFNADHQTDFFDYLDFAAAFAEEDQSADFNGDRQVDLFDYLDFVAAFDAGCA
jgi:hypothetical protein